MFFFLSKVLYYIIMPAGLLTITLLAALLVKNPRYRRRWLQLGIGLWFLLGNGFLSNEIALWWEVPPTTLAKTTKPRIGIVLTGGIMRSDIKPFNRIFLADHADRMGQALLLYKAGLIQKILISGGGDPIIPREIANEGKLTAQFLQAGGIPANAIILENKSLNTYENARFTAAILRQKFSDNEYVLITSAFHMQRAVACFQKQQIQVVPYSADIMGQQRLYTPDNLILPSEGAFRDSYQLLRELVGYVVYKLMGYA
ncbi:YdcF family protein [Tellurirhabdus bombi]|uniref:YdcF family protein n=1 Tax=Tellurirhabdus bombi TaxID=2907205 RepID=UPI001F336FD9|nr:YdcF family protein [Tellurirhabdus bombi]